MAANVPVLVSSNYPNSGWPSYMMIGSTAYFIPGDPQYSTWWFVVVDLQTLNVVAQEVSDEGNVVPPSVQQYVGNSQYFLFFVASNMMGGNFPQGDLYNMLVQVGAAKRLPWMEQIVAQTGTGYFINFSYILAATMSANDLPGFEEFGDYGRATLVFEFMPITIGGKTIYTPIQNFPGTGSLVSETARKPATTPRGLSASKKFAPARKAVKSSTSRAPASKARKSAAKRAAPKAKTSTKRAAPAKGKKTSKGRKTSKRR
jgi:hypothetical protein